MEKPEQSLIPATPPEAIRPLPRNIPEWVYVAARVLATKHGMNNSDRGLVHYEEWLRIISKWNEGLSHANVPEWMAMSLVLGVLDAQLGKSVENLIRATPQLIAAAGKNSAQNRNWQKMLHDRQDELRGELDAVKPLDAEKPNSVWRAEWVRKKDKPGRERQGAPVIDVPGEED